MAAVLTPACSSSDDGTSVGDGDGGAHMDAATPRDATMDAASTNDGSPTIDAAAKDSGSPVDAAMPVDGSMPNDAAMPADAATPLDAAMPSDAATPVDAAMPIDASPPVDAACGCQSAADCPSTGNQCIVATCTSCVCGTANASAGTACSMNGGVACDGMGSCVQSCAGAEMHTLSPGDPTLVINATTTNASSLYTTSCTTTANRGVMYALDLTGEGTFTATITAAAGSALLPVMDIRASCMGGADSCTSYGTSSANIAEDLAGLAQSLNVTMTAGTYYIVVTGSGGTSGDFTLNAKLSAAQCGDGVLNPGEVCDPSVPVNGDGCGAPGSANACQLIAPGIAGGGPAGSDACPGQATVVPAGTTVLTEAQGLSTWGYADDNVGSCLVAGGGSAGGVDRVFQLTPAKSGTLTVSVGYQADGVTSICGSNVWAPDCWAPMLYARSSCATASTELACSTGPATDPHVPQTISFPVTVGMPYWIFVDGWDGFTYSTGPFNLVVQLQ
jgi:cysteine-rich repeat protein